jgi:hypothetical protein
MAEKMYYQTDNVGKAKYTVSTHDGVQTHKDGSPFFGIEIFKNKVKRNKYVSDLIKEGYVYKNPLYS